MKCCASRKQWAFSLYSHVRLPEILRNERERIQEIFDIHQRFSDAAQRKMLGYVHELDSRLSALPGEIEASLNPQQIAKLLGESLRQHFLKSGMPDTVKGLQTTAAAMTSAQKELSAALHKLSDSHNGVVAQVEQANSRLTYSLESRAKTIDALLHEWKSDMLRIWIPLVAGAAICIGLVAGMEIENYRDSVAPTIATPVSTSAPASSISGLQPSMPTMTDKMKRLRHHH
jgi:hypothetical protein